jgi:hypothetical protein
MKTKNVILIGALLGLGYVMYKNSKAKASANKAHKETNKAESGIKMMSLIAKTVRGVKKMDATG